MISRTVGSSSTTSTRGVTPVRLVLLVFQGLRAFLPVTPIALRYRRSLLTSLCMKFRSPLRGPWLTSVLGVVLLAALPLVIVTGLLDYVAYGPGQSIPGDVGLLHLPAIDWPTRPVVALPADPGRARRPGARPRARGAGQAVVGDPAAVRLAAGEVARARVGAARRC